MSTRPSFMFPAALAILLCACASKSGGEESESDASVDAANASPDAGMACPEADMRCVYTFKYVDRGEASVEVRGDFRSDGWSVGEVMQKQGSTWIAHGSVPYNKDVQYKLVLNGDVWIKDPANPLSISDGNQNENSLLEALTCVEFSCASE